LNSLNNIMFLLISGSCNLLFLFIFIYFYFKIEKKNFEKDNIIKILEEKNQLLNNEKNLFIEEKQIFEQKINSLLVNIEDQKKIVNESIIEKIKLEKDLILKDELIGILNGKNNELSNNLKNNESDIQLMRSKILSLSSQNSSLLSEKDTISKNLTNLHEVLLPQFQNIAMNLLKDNSKHFNDSSSENLSKILNPLNEKIKIFETKMQDIFNYELKEKSSLKEAINSVINSNENIRKEAFKLSNALKGNRIALGHWGEVVLENILNSSGLRKDEDYFLQANFNDNSEKSDKDIVKLKPDALIKLPDEKYVVIDSKISFFNYSAYEDAISHDEKSIFVKQFISNIKLHIESLSSKEYHINLGINTPEITLMFIPVESWYNIAIKHFPEIYNFAWNKNIAIVSPSTLFVVLKTIAYIWKGKLQAQNSFEIASMGGKIYDSIVDLMEILNDIGKSIQKSNNVFEKAMLKIKSGRGNLISRAEKLRNLGVKNNKLIPSEFIEDTIEELETS